MGCTYSQAQEAAILDSIPKDMSRPWEDPNPQPGERTIAQALQGLGQTGHPPAAAAAAAVAAAVAAVAAAVAPLLHSILSACLCWVEALG